MPRIGMGMPIVSGASNAPVTVIDDVLWEDYGGSGGEISMNYTRTRSNSMLYSQDATNAESYTKTNTAIDSTLYVAPDGSTTANAIESNSTGAKNYKMQQGSLSVTSGSTYTLSVHAKKGNLGFAKVQLNDGATDFTADFNLNTGAITNTANLIDQAVDAMDNDWYRCSITFQAGNTSTGATATVFAQSVAGDATPNVAVSGIVLLYVWGFQLEQDITQTAYIATTSAAVTKTTTLSDTSDVWDFDSSDLMPEADPNGEGVWDDMPELVTNGSFATNISGWTAKDSSISWSSGKILVDNSSGNAGGGPFQNVGLVTGNQYEMTATIQLLTGSTNGVFNLISSASGGTGQTTVYTGSALVVGGAAVTETFTFTPGTGDVSVQFSVDEANATYTVDNITLREYAITPQDV